MPAGLKWNLLSDEAHLSLEANSFLVDVRAYRMLDFRFFSLGLKMEQSGSVMINALQEE